MTGFVIAWAALGSVQVSPYADHGAAVAVTLRMKGMAGPLLLARPDEAEIAEPQRERLGRPTVWNLRDVPRVARLEAQSDELLNALILARDVAGAADELNTSPWSRLAWRAAAVRLSERLDALGAVYCERGLYPPEVRAKAGLLVRYVRGQLRAELTTCLATLPRPRR